MQEKDKKSGYAAIIGRPNVGKSTLMNHLIGQKIAITSNKPQTTRNRIKTVYTDERGQVVFFDTPGIHRSRNKLGEYMDNVAIRTLSQADVILWLVEPSAFIGKQDEQIIRLLKQVNTPIILVVNKIDTVKKEQVGEVIKLFHEALPVKKTVAVSALRSVRVDEVLDMIYEELPVGPMFYDEDTVTDLPMRDIAAEIIREKALRRLQDEIPHGIAVVIDKMRERPDGSIMDVEASVICERDSHKGIIIGKGGEMLKKIGTDARKDIEELTEMQVNLKLFVKVRKDWRDSESFLRTFGYKPEKD